MNNDRLQANNTLDIYTFFRIFSVITPQIYALENNNQTLKIRPAYPDEIVKILDGTTRNPTGTFPPYITYQLAKREPGTMASKPFGDRKELKPKYRAIPTDEKTEILGQVFDNLVHFECWSLSSAGVDDLVEWFEEYMVKYVYYYKSLGIKELLYYSGGTFNRGSVDEATVSVWRNPLKVRSSTYYIRTEKLWTIDHDEIERIIANIYVGSTIPTDDDIPDVITIDGS